MPPVRLGVQQGRTQPFTQQGAGHRRPTFLPPRLERDVIGRGLLPFPLPGSPPSGRAPPQLCPHLCSLDQKRELSGVSSSCCIVEYQIGSSRIGLSRYYPLPGRTVWSILDRTESFSLTSGGWHAQADSP